MMICKKCQKEIEDNYKGSICPHCSNPLNKGYKNKFVSSDLASAGTTIAKSSFIKLKKDAPKKNKELGLKDFNSYIDYKTAKEDKANKKSAFYNVYSNEKDVSSTGAKSSKAKYVRKEKSSSTFRNNTSSSYKETEPTKETQKAFSSGLNNVSVNNQVNYQQPQYNFDNTVNNQPTPKNGNRLFAGFCFVAVLVIVAVFIFKNYNNTDYYFGQDVKTYQQNTNADVALENDDMLQYEGKSKSGQKPNQSGIGVTSIVYDYQYLKKLTFKDLNDVLKLIASDSNRQKGNCLQNVVTVERSIISKYGITAVNFCEMDVDLAIELENVVKYIYDEYPSARNYLTNITLANLDKATYIAAFMPVFTFGTSNTNNDYPVAIKSQIILNAKYFLDSKKLTNTVNKGVRAGYFPPNATRSSTIAHEFGHYLAYVALCNHYHSGRLNFVRASEAAKMFTVYDDFNIGLFSLRILKEAYTNYKATYNNGYSFDDFRASISTYAMAKDKSGNYIYDETIAEAFHDCYLNGDLAQPASVAIVKVLESYL